MSCNGCRVLRKACVENCILRLALQCILGPEAQGYATLFLAKFFGRSDLLARIAAVPQSHRSAMFRSLLFEACGRTINPVTGAVGLLATGNWQVCQAAVTTVLNGGTLRPMSANNETAAPPISAFNAARAPFRTQYSHLVGASTHPSPQTNPAVASSSFSPNYWQLQNDSSPYSEMQSEMIEVENNGPDGTSNGEGGAQDEIKLLNLFV